MRNLAFPRITNVIAPQAIKDDADWVGGKDSTPVSVDTRLNGVKSNYLLWLCILGATDIAVAELSFHESDDDSTYTEVLDYINDTGAPGAIAADDDNQIMAVGIDLTDGARKRYHQIDATAGDGTSGSYLTVIALEFFIDQAPNTLAELGTTFHGLYEVTPGLSWS